MAMCYVARKSCRCIVAAWPVNLDSKRQAELLKQFALAGYAVEQAPESDVRYSYGINCDCSRVPLAPPEPTVEITFDEVVQAIQTIDVVTVTRLQRELRLGYTRAVSFYSQLLEGGHIDANGKPTSQAVTEGEEGQEIPNEEEMADLTEEQWVDEEEDVPAGPDEGADEEDVDALSTEIEY